jgi:CubicO group peptidase (beta-lactamase class C family)
MKDTSFSVPEDKLGRLHTAYQSTAGKLSKSANQQAGSGPVYFSGAMGLVSTAEDYLRFAQMLANGGILNGKRILAPRTIAIMSANHLGDLYNQGQRTHGMGFGLLVEVVQDTVISGRNLSVGSFGWDGAAGTRLWVDPKEKLAIVIMVQTSFAASVQLHRDVENAVAQSIIQE